MFCGPNLQVQTFTQVQIVMAYWALIFQNLSFKKFIKLFFMGDYDARKIRNFFKEASPPSFNLNETSTQNKWQ